ncbi:MAG: DUF1460 domain-containing protein [Syntrophobacterales bacterium]|jgi:hypothetical protein|nr:DUF1460 domain-containing protein [Syntrophobacterales bacterium]
MKEVLIRLGKWSEESLDQLIRRASLIPDPGPRIELISREFLGIPYCGFTLVGGSDTIETFVIDLEEVDCFTFIDYVEAMRISVSYSEFKTNLAKVRYRGGLVAYEGRNHFFLDWIESNSSLVCDVTDKIGQTASRHMAKFFNQKEDGALFLPGLIAKKKDVHYIPSSLIDHSIEGRLETGDYVGVYSMTTGLDVSHVGIFIRGKNGASLRHASSADEKRKVVDQDFRSYMAAKPGIVVLRPQRSDR